MLLPCKMSQGNSIYLSFHEKDILIGEQKAVSS